MNNTNMTGCASPAKYSGAARSTVLMNNGWRFHRGSLTGAEAADLDDSSWEAVGLPHSASIPYWNTMTEVYEGDTWYRKEFTAAREWQGRHVFVDFEGAFQHAWVYLNGRLLGEHKGGYTGFCYDMTPALCCGERNVLAVRVRNGWDAKIAPRAGDSIFCNGLNRNVRFVTTQAQHVGWCGQTITTPQVSRDSATVRVRTEIRNEDSAVVPGKVLVEVTDAARKVVTRALSEVDLQPGQTTVLTQDFPTISSPSLWSPETPYLYTVKTRLYTGDRLLDECDERLGIRWFAFTEEEGFFLNGEHCYLWGYNVHEDRAGWGFAGTDASMVRDMMIMKGAGANVIRACHNPHPRAFYRACDEIGLLVWDELHFWGRGGFPGGEDGSYMAEAYPVKESDRPEFDRNLKDSLRDMIREHRNHPSIIVWSLGNETVMQMQEPLLSEARRMFGELHELAKALDSSRPTGVGNVLPQEGFADVNGFNGGNPKEDPIGSKPIVTTEYHYRRQPPPDSWRSGIIAWAGFDYGTHCVNKHTGKSFGLNFGLYDYHRLLKESNSAHFPDGFTPPPKGVPSALALTADKCDVRTDGSDDTQLVVTVVDANWERIDADVPVTFTVVSGPGLLPTGHTWETSTANMGRQAVEMRVRAPGRTVVETNSPGLEPARVEVRGIR